MKKKEKGGLFQMCLASPGSYSSSFCVEVQQTSCRYSSSRAPHPRCLAARLYPGLLCRYDMEVQGGLLAMRTCHMMAS